MRSTFYIILTLSKSIASFVVAQRSFQPDANLIFLSLNYQNYRNILILRQIKIQRIKGKSKTRLTFVAKGREKKNRLRKRKKENNGFRNSIIYIYIYNKHTLF